MRCCNMRNDCFAVHNTPEARDCMNTPTRGLNHLVTGGRTLCNAGAAQTPQGSQKPPLTAFAWFGGSRWVRRPRWW